jgi:signal transduction histidine kinase
MRRRLGTLRLRVTLATALVLAIVLGSVGAFVDASVASHARGALDEALRVEGEALAALVRLEGAEIEVDTDGEPGFEGYATARSGAYYEVWARGRLPLRSASLAGATLAPPDLVALEPAAAVHERLETLPGPFEIRLRVLTRRIERFASEGEQEPGPATAREAVLVRVGRSTAGVDAHRRSVRTALMWSAPLGLLVGALAAWLLAGRAMAPIARLAAQAREVGRRPEAARLDVEGVEGELRELTATLNDAFARLEELGARERRFAADASHELRTPLAVVRAHLELALSRERPPQEYRTALDTALTGALRLEAVVRQLLLLAGVEAGRLPTERIDLADVVQRAVSAAREAAPVGAPGITLHAVEVELPVAGDAVLLERMVANLLENALQHAARSPEIAVELERDGAEVRLRVLDRGPGVPDELRPRLFERFARGDVSRGRDTGGAGLGLAIVRAIARQHGGDVTAAARAGGGTSMEVRLPLAPDAAAADPGPQA